MTWRRLTTKPHELKIALTLSNGQCFNWKKANSTEWIGVIGRNVIGLKDTNVGVAFRSYAGTDFDVLHHDLEDYFQLNVSMDALCSTWLKRKKSDKRFEAIAKCMRGMRIVRQEPLECLISFICSSNNNISRITLMLDRLRSNYGEELYCHETLGSIYSFPSTNRLAEITESELRDLGFGYRAKFVTSTAKKLLSMGGSKYLKNLRGSNNETLRDALTAFPGVGPKVADCVALFSLDATSSVPVDTHVWRIACRDYDDENGTLRNAKSVTKKLYDHVGNVFYERFGTHAGWAHSLMFAAELPQFRGLLPEDIRQDMITFSKWEKTVKQKAKEEKKKRSRNDVREKKTKTIRGGGRAVKKKKKKGSK